jgi:hypothetical protein
MWPCYKILDHLPKIPNELKQVAWDYATAEGVVFNSWVLGNSHGRELIKDGKYFGISTGLGRKRINDQFDKWVSNNITDSFIDVGICVSQEGMDHSGPHRDQSRNYTLLYLLRQGGNAATTSFWKAKSPQHENQNHSDYDDLILLDQVLIPLETWCLIDAKTTHSVENIKEGRVAVQVSLDHIPTEWNI